MARSAPKSSQPWFAQAAEKCVREGMSLREAAEELEIVLTSDEAGNLSRRRAFQEALLAARMAWWEELGNAPTRTKASALGRMDWLIQKLIEDKQWEKALEGQLKAAKVAGWMGPETEVNLISGLTAKELEDVKTKLIERTGKKTGTNLSKPPSDADPTLRIQ